MAGMPKRRVGFIVSASLALVAAAGTPPLAAGTDLGTAGGLTYIFEESAGIVAPNFGSAAPACPDGTHVVGGGEEVGGNAAESHFNTMFPIDGLDGNDTLDDGWRSHAWNDSGPGKSVDVIAVCRKGKVKYRTSPAKVVKLGHASTARAKCPDGSHVSGGGSAATGPVAESWVNSSYPFDSADADHAPDDGWKVRQYNISAAPQVQMTVYAICGANMPHYETAGPVSVGDPGGVISLVDCPDSRHITAGGIRLSQVPAGNAHPVTLKPDDGTDADSIPDDRLRAVAGVDSNTDGAMTTYAICR